MNPLRGVRDAILCTEPVKSQRVFWPNVIAFAGIAGIVLCVQFDRALMPLAWAVWALGTALLVRFVVVRSSKRKLAESKGSRL